jgi:glycosyltransferase involved in cell wall biosynthesis
MPSAHEITVIIPTIPPRRAMLNRATDSIRAQTHQAKATMAVRDDDHIGAGPVRTVGLMRVETDWVAFLDDDDEFKPDHLAKLCQAQDDTGADVLWPWFEVVGGTDPFPEHRGKQWDIKAPHIFPICVLVRTELAQKTTGFRGTTGDWMRDDFPFYEQIWKMGGIFHHIPDITWKWHHHFANTSGQPERWPS